MLLIPAYAAIRIERRALRQQRRSAVHLDAEAELHHLGKFFSALVLAMLVFSACAPFMTFTYLLRGIDIPTILFVLGIDLLAMLLGTQMALFLAPFPPTGG